MIASNRQFSPREISLGSLWIRMFVCRGACGVKPSATHFLVSRNSVQRDIGEKTFTLTLSHIQVYLVSTGAYHLHGKSRNSIWKTHQMVRIIPFGVLLKLWASGTSSELFESRRVTMMLLNPRFKVAEHSFPVYRC